MNTFDGVLLVDKPRGCTSHDVVDAVRRTFKIKKVGHCGTLDPIATGLLVLVLGKATKLSEKLIADDKIYEGVIKFGEVTDTHDADGKVIQTAPVPALSLDQLNALAGQFQGDVLQIPPMVSAVKKQGVPLYKLARKGIELPREPRLVHIYSFVFTDYQPPLAEFRMACTKGTYVRTVAHDLGQKLGCGAHLYALRRIGSGKFHVRDATPLDQLLALDPTGLAEKIITLDRLSRLLGQP